MIYITLLDISFVGAPSAVSFPEQLLRTDVFFTQQSGEESEKDSNGYEDSNISGHQPVFTHGDLACDASGGHGYVF